MRTVFPFNHGWLFAPRQVEFDADDSHFEPVVLPHTNCLFDHRTVYEDDYQFVSTYRKRFEAPAELDGQRVFLDFEGAMLMSRVYLNDELVGQHAGGYTPFSVDITRQMQPGANTLHVVLDSRELPEIPPNGFRLDFLPFGGIYRPVSLRLVHPTHIANLFAQPQDVLGDTGLIVAVQVSEPAPGCELRAELRDAEGGLLASASAPLDGAAAELAFEPGLDVSLWKLERPTLYTLDTILSQAGAELDRVSTRIGFRAAEFRADGLFYLNGHSLKLVGQNRHQTYVYIGAAAPERLQRQDADIIKNELGCNIVRTSHYPQSTAFLDRCDEIGLLVFEEMPGWQYIGDQAWQNLLAAQLEEMILRDRNHPAIVLWGVRINESPDDDALYARTNALAHELDPTRQTGGVRNFIDSSFLEDVYTFNDFPLGFTEPRAKPHLITEFGGHMLPTKAFDNEDRLIEQALLHARKQDQQLGRSDVAGAISWCAFDYHTHPEFGSGDRICHHGVMDIFRLPKWVAYFYRSQKAPEQEVVLKVASYWTLGDRASGGNNPLTVFSNCDEIEVFIGGIRFGRFSPDREQFPHLAHPPFTVRWPDPYNPWGEPSGDLKVVGYLDGKPAAQQEIAAGQRASALTLAADHDQLIADGADMTRVVVSIVDKYGNPLPYQHRVIEFELTGDAQLIGENPLAFIGGSAACLVKSGRTAGTVIVKASCRGFAPAEVSIGITEPVTEVVREKQSV